MEQRRTTAFPAGTASLHHSRRRRTRRHSWLHEEHQLHGSALHRGAAARPGRSHRIRHYPESSRGRSRSTCAAWGRSCAPNAHANADDRRVLPDRRHPGTLRVRSRPRASSDAATAVPAACLAGRFRCIVAKKRRKRHELSLGFPILPELSSPKQSLEAVVSHFQSAHREPDSAVRAIHHQPAAEGVFADIPAAVDAAPARRAREARHRAALLAPGRGLRPDRRRASNVVIVTPTASGKTLCYNLPVLNLLLRRPRRARMYLFPTKALAEDQLHEFQARRGRDGRRHPRLHLRRRHAAGRAQSHPRSAPTSCSPIPTCCTPGSCRTTPSGRSYSRICATS